MARKYDIIERLRAKNERPFIVIDEEHSYSVDTSKTNVMAIMAMVDEIDSKEESVDKDIELIEKVFEMALGKQAVEYINSLDLTMEGYMYIVDVIMAAINGQELEDEVDSKLKK